jgi:predicted SAM-dependent methyltransferase
MDIVGKPTILHDVRVLPLPIESNTYDLVYMSHILEHIPWFQTQAFLKEILRGLKTGGTIEVWVPDFGKIVDAYLKRKPGDPWRRDNPHGDFMVWVNGRIFTYGPGEENWHRAVFDEASLRQHLKASGFKHTQRLQKPRGVDHGPINLGVAAVK